MIERTQLVILGSGFGGSILARVARRLDVDVVLIDRGRHPRFAVGESSTPLGNLALRRLAERYTLPDLRDLASYGRWLARYPRLQRGLKRGFTFFAHRPGEPFRPAADHGNRLLVAASPSDEVADTHWLRSDVDAFLADRAAAEGVDLRQQTEVDSIEADAGGWRLSGRSAGGGELALRADLLVDATGAGGALARRLPIASRLARVRPRSAVVYGHFSGVPGFVETLDAALTPGPYPDDRAAVHHLLEEGWAYVLPFDHDLVSAGVVISEPPSGSEWPAAGESPERLLRRRLGRYPSLARQFEHAVAVEPVRALRRMQHRLESAAGPGWALLPHAFAFFDPIFSTGIAWSLLAVERLGRLLEQGIGAVAAERGLERYGALLEREAERIERLVELAYLTLDDPPLLFDTAMLYFAAVSWAEVRQRIDTAASETAAWEGFLGTGDPLLDRPFEQATERLRHAPPVGAPRRPAFRSAFSGWLREAIAPRNLAGLADPARRNLYPVDPQTVVDGAALLGLAPDEVRRRLPRLLAV